MDIEDTLELKIQALAQHKSQVDATRPGVEAMIRGWAERNAQGQPMRYAEAFKRIVLR